MKETTSILETANSAQRIGRIRKVSSTMKWVITVCLGLVVLLAIALPPLFLAPDFFDLGNESIDFGDVHRAIGSIPLGQRALLMVMVTSFVAIAAIMLWNLRALFTAFQRQVFFAASTLSRVVWVGIWFVVLGVLDVLEEPVGSILATADYSEGKRMLSIGLDGGELFFVIFGIFFIVLGWILREAASVWEENKQFI